MGKRIGAKIMVMMIVMSLMYVVTSVASGFAQEQALGGMTRLSEKWVQLQRAETQVVKKSETVKFSANMIVHYEMPAVQESLSKSIPEKIAETEAVFTQMQAIVDSLDEADCIGVTKADIKNALNAYQEATAVSQAQGARVAELYLAGDIEGSANANNGATQNINAQTEAEAAFMELIETASNNMMQHRIEVVQAYSNVSNTLFYVYLIATVLIIIYINKMPDICSVIGAIRHS